MNAPCTQVGTPISNSYEFFMFLFGWDHSWAWATPETSSPCKSSLSPNHVSQVFHTPHVSPKLTAQPSLSSSLPTASRSHPQTCRRKIRDRSRAGKSSPRDPRRGRRTFPTDSGLALRQRTEFRTSSGETSTSWVLGPERPAPGDGRGRPPKRRCRRRAPQQRRSADVQQGPFLGGLQQ